MNQIASEKMRWTSFLCSIFIALIHLSASFVDYNQEIINYYQQLAVPAMSYYFLSSAYFRFRNYKKEDYLPKLKKRVWTLLIPYVVWNTVEFIICSVRGYITPSLWQFVKGFIFVYIPVLDIAKEPMIGALWFVIRLLVYEVTVPFIFYFVKNKKLYAGLMVILLPLIHFGNINYYSYIYWLPVYMTGAFIAVHYKDKFEELLAVQPLKNHPIGKYVMTILGLAAYGIFVYITWKVDLHYDFRRWLAVPVVLFGMYLASWVPKARWVVVSGSFFLYCAHIPARFLIGPELMRLQPIFGTVVFPQVYFILIIVIVFLTEWLMHKLCPKVLTFFTGAR